MNRMFTVMLLIPTVLALAQQPAKEDQEKEKKFREQAAKAADTTKQYGWTPGAVTGINLTQASFKDWAAGGENSLAYNAWSILQAVHLAERTEWINNVKLTFGQARLGDKELRKTDDEIYFESLFIYRLAVVVNPYAAVTVRTQFAPGYIYPDNAPRQQTSAFFDPGYLMQSVGVAFAISPILTTRLGVGVKEVVTSKFSAPYADDPSTAEVEKVKVQGGLESVSEVNYPFMENMLFTSRLELFAPFKTMDQIFVRWDNLLTAKVNKLIDVNFNLQLVQDVTVTPRTQVKEMLSIGVNYTLL